MDYDIGSTTQLAVSIFDKNKSMGNAVFDVAELLGARGNTKAVKLKKGGMYVEPICNGLVLYKLTRFALFLLSSLASSLWFARAKDREYCVSI